MRLKLLPFLAVLIIFISSPLPTAQAQAFRMLPNGTMSIPYSVTDSSGSQWMIYQQGMLRQQGNMPMFSQAAVLNVNGSSPSSNSNQARMDEKTQEVVFENMSAGGVQVTRRILVNRQQCYVRYIDIFKNPTAQEMSVRVQLNSNFNYGMQGSQMVNDPKNKNRPMGCTVMLEAGRAIFEEYAARGSKLAPQINVPMNNNVIQTSMQLTIPAGKQVALFHIHGTAANQDAAAQLLTSMKDSDLLQGVPTALRKILANAPAMQSIGDREVLRGELFDVIELRSGDMLRGTIAESSYKLDTFYGSIELQADHVVGLINVGQFRPRQLLVTSDGEVFGGNLGKETVTMQLSSGQTTQVPLTQIVRAGYRKRSGEPEEWNFNRPMVSLRSGERMVVTMPADPIEVMTRYGLLKLNPAAIDNINFQSEDHGVHQVTLTDGSTFAGLVTSDKFPLNLTGTTTQQQVSFPTAMIARLQFTKRADGADDDDSAPSLEMNNEDVMRGTLDGQLQIDANFDTIAINASEIRSLTHSADAGMDVQVTLWDQTTLSGQLRDPLLACTLKSGLTVKVPLALVTSYENPDPRPSQTMVDRIKAVVADLSAEDWKQRETAEAQLVTMGPAVTGVLKEMSPSQPLEAQQRIDSVLKQLEKKAAPAPAPAGN